MQPAFMAQCTSAQCQASLCNVIPLRNVSKLYQSFSEFLHFIT